MTEFKTGQEVPRAPPRFPRMALLSLIWLGPTEDVDYPSFRLKLEYTGY